MQNINTHRAAGFLVPAEKAPKAPAKDGEAGSKASKPGVFAVPTPFYRYSVHMSSAPSVGKEDPTSIPSTPKPAPKTGDCVVPGGLN